MFRDQIFDQGGKECVQQLSLEVVLKDSQRGLNGELNWLLPSLTMVTRPSTSIRGGNAELRQAYFHCVRADAVLLSE
jgi:hypothetical protein